MFTFVHFMRLLVTLVVFILYKSGLMFSFVFLSFSTEDTLKALKDRAKEPEVPEPEPEPTTEVLFLCSFEGCGKTFIDAGALRKHSHIHGERQYVCHYEGCGKVSVQQFYYPPSYLFNFVQHQILLSSGRTVGCT